MLLLALEKLCIIRLITTNFFFFHETFFVVYCHVVVWKALSYSLYFLGKLGPSSPPFQNWSKSKLVNKSQSSKKYVTEIDFRPP